VTDDQRQRAADVSDVAAAAAAAVVVASALSRYHWPISSSLHRRCKRRLV